MHARLSTAACQQQLQHQQQHQQSKRPSSSTSSPIARFSLAPTHTQWENRNWGASSSQLFIPGASSSRPGQTFHQRKSICEPIREEPSTSAIEIISDLAALEELQVYKRAHRSRPKTPTRSQSAPLLISTNTTQPVYINHKNSKFVRCLFAPQSYLTSLPATPCPTPSCLGAIPSVFAAQVISTSRLPQQVLQPRQCVMRSVRSSNPSRTQKPRGCVYSYKLLGFRVLRSCRSL